MPTALGIATPLITTLVLSASAIVGSLQSIPSLTQLTAPVSSLPPGCALRPPAPGSRVAVRGEIVRVNGASWSPLPTNPWVGTDREIVAAVRKTIDATPRMVPDGPPLDTSAAAEFELKWADNVLEAYYAGYATGDGSDVDVRAVTFDSVTVVRPEPLSGALNPAPRVRRRFVRGATVVLVSADTVNECLEAVLAHVESVR